MTIVERYMCDICEKEYPKKKSVITRRYFVGTTRCEIEGRTYKEHREVHICMDCKDIVPYPTDYKKQEKIGNTIFKGKGIVR